MQRERIMELVQIRGGIHKSQLCRELELAWGTIGYHLRVLSGKGDVVLQYVGQELWVFHPLIPREQYHVLAAAAKPERRKLLGWLSRRDGTTIRELSDDLEASRYVIRHHLGHLMEAGLVERSGNRSHRYHLRVEDDG